MGHGARARNCHPKCLNCVANILDGLLHLLVLHKTTKLKCDVRRQILQAKTPDVKPRLLLLKSLRIASSLLCSHRDRVKSPALVDTGAVCGAGLVKQWTAHGSKTTVPLGATRCWTSTRFMECGGVHHSAPLVARSTPSSKDRVEQPPPVCHTT
ncbi:hypothetical protein RRG08_022603 [Elysia crispata]|uniref:Uncharacterized protein n=1 Tax=Elysia crispata TaxID=231223 RepID=A0AAE1D9C5_9GAST|nr:hypothetical protein RRG08_022603 [Elysia crispata]